MIDIMVHPDKARDARARALAPFVASWPKHTLKVAWGAFPAGTVFRRAPGSHGEKYLVNSVACQCPDYAEGGHICKHIRAVRLSEQQPAPKPRRTVEEVFGVTCDSRGCTDDAQDGDPRCRRHQLVDAF